MKFKGFDGYIEIFKGGPQVDNKGRTHDGSALIDKALAGFNAAVHEPPICVGHAKDNAPAFGWVEGLKETVRDGTRYLSAKFKDVVPEFADLAVAGLYKKRSAAFYPDGRLRHVAFLGAAPPAVKGLADIGFNDDAADVLEFDETNPWTWRTIAGVFRKLREYILEKDGAEKADAIIGNWDIEEIKDEETRALSAPATEAAGLIENQFTESEEHMGIKEKITSMLTGLGVDPAKVTIPDDALPADAGDSASFTEADIDAAKKTAAQKARADVEAEFAEKALADEKAAAKAKITDWVKVLVAGGNVLPAWEKMGLANFCEGLDAMETIEFAEDSDKVTAFDWFKAFVEELPKVIDFSEVATRDKDVGGGDAAGKLTTLVAAKRKEKPEIDYSAAFSEVQAEHPALAAEYAKDVNA